MDFREKLPHGGQTEIYNRMKASGNEVTLKTVRDVISGATRNGKFNIEIEQIAMEIIREYEEHTAAKEKFFAQVSEK